MSCVLWALFITWLRGEKTPFKTERQNETTALSALTIVSGSTVTAFPRDSHASFSWTALVHLLPPDCTWTQHLNPQVIRSWTARCSHNQPRGGADRDKTTSVRGSTLFIFFLFIFLIAVPSTPSHTRVCDLSPSLPCKCYSVSHDDVRLSCKQNKTKNRKKERGKKPFCLSLNDLYVCMYVSSVRTGRNRFLFFFSVSNIGRAQ